MFTLPSVLLNLLGKRYHLVKVAVGNISAMSGEESLPTVMFVLGGPGAGKGTQCTNLVEDFGFEHLSAGDLLRAERNSGSKDGALIDEFIREGKIVPVEITINLLDKAMTGSIKNKFLIDGFPRNKDNLDGWVKMMTDKVNLLGVLFFDCPEDVCIKRIMKRSETSGRKDDNEESLRKRFRTYYTETMPIIDHFKNKQMVKHVDASQNPDQVYEAVKRLMDNR